MASLSQADALIEQLQLSAHPEGGWYRETWRSTDAVSGRAMGTAILFLLKADEASHWHRVDAVELWLWQGGDPLELGIAAGDDEAPSWFTLGADVTQGHLLQGIVPKDAWQSARHSLGGQAGYSLVSCIVVPGFTFDGFELAPPGWSPGERGLA